jgi:predicted Zn-dependent protease with MMP-like domain
MTASTEEILEAGWDALDAGDPAAARKQASKLGEADPDALMLLAACAREEDDVAGAAKYLRAAINADGEWAAPQLAMAELLAPDPERIDEAHRYAARAADLADEEPEYLAALVLKAGLEAERGDAEAARKTLAELPPASTTLGDAEAALDIADLHLVLGDVALARERLRTLTAAEPELADAWHALGGAAAELGDEDEMRTAWKRTWALDAAPGAGAGAARRLSDAEVAAEAEAALAELSPRAQQLLSGVPIVIADRPAEADVEGGMDPRALGMFSGTAYPDVSHLGGQPGLTQILLFRSNLERVAADEDELREEIRTTLVHETGHFFGLDDAELEERGLG